MMWSKYCYNILFVCLIFMTMTAGCPAKTEIPYDPGLCNENLGVGISLREDISEVKKTVKEAKNYEVVIVQREDLSKHAPYDTKENAQDRIIAIYTETGEKDASNENHLTDVGYVDEIRCYLTEPNDSVITLASKKAAWLKEEDAILVYGDPVQRTETSDAEVHLLYYFSMEGDRNQMIELVLSFHQGGYCFALSMSIQPRIK